MNRRWFIASAALIIGILCFSSCKNKARGYTLPEESPDGQTTADSQIDSDDNTDQVGDGRLSGDLRYEDKSSPGGILEKTQEEKRCPTSWRTLGGPEQDEGRTVLQLPSGELIIGGVTSSKGAGQADFWILKVDLTGHVIWDKTYGGPESEDLTALIRTKHGRLVAVGETRSRNPKAKCKFSPCPNFWIVETDDEGNHRWDKVYPSDRYEYATSVVETSDGGFVLVGNTREKDAYVSDIRLLRLDSKGDLLWEKTFGGSDDDTAYTILEVKAGEYLIAGVTSSKGSGGDCPQGPCPDFWVLKVDGHGNLLWDKTYGGKGDERALSMVQSSDGNFVIAGLTNSKGTGGPCAHEACPDFWLVKIDGEGNMLWDQVIGREGLDFARSIALTRDGGFAVAGFSNYIGKMDSDAVMFKTDASGKLVWYTDFTESDWDSSAAMIELKNGDFVAVGYTESVGAGQRDLLFIHLDGNGRYLCF